MLLVSITRCLCFCSEGFHLPLGALDFVALDRLPWIGLPWIGCVILGRNLLFVDLIVV